MENCPRCGKAHRAYPKKCVNTARIAGALDHALIMYGYGSDRELIRRKLTLSGKTEWRDSLDKWYEMEEYIKRNFPEYSKHF